MNENLNLVEILKDCPKGTKLYSPLVGEVELCKIEEGYMPAISVKPSETEKALNCPPLILTIYADGQYFLNLNGECMLFPSKVQRDWSKFTPPLKDKQLVWCWEDDGEFGRYLRFYDAKNKRTFCASDGDRTGYSYANYEPYMGEYPDWAKEALNLLVDKR